MKRVIFSNIAALVLFALGFCLSLLGFWYLQFFAGLFLFFLVGANIVLLLAKITNRRLQIAEFVGLTALVSFLFNPTIIYIFSLLFHKIAQESFTIVIFLAYWFLSFFLLLVCCFWNKKRLLNFDFKYKTFLPVFLLLMFVVALGFLLYPYVPEADGYGYMVKIRDSLAYHRMPLHESRPLFFVLVWLFLFLTKIPIYWLFKIVFPLILFLVLGLIFYTLSLSKVKNRLLLIISSLAFLACPVIFAEILYARPQTVFILVFVVLLFVLRNFLLSPQPRDYLWLIFLLLLNVLGLKVHLFFVFNILLVFVVLVFVLREPARKYPLESLVLFSLVVFGSYPLLRDLGFVDQILRLARPFWNALIHPHIDLWFIDHYRNVFGDELGWPGVTQLYYYGYNLGLFLPCLLCLSLKFRSKIKLVSEGVWIWLLSLVMFLAIAEFFPRLGLAFLPDRAWLFASLSLMFFVPLALSALSGFLAKNKISLAVLVSAFAVSVLASLFVVYAKQGWVNKEELKAVEFIRQNTPEDAAFITQKGNFPLVKYFAQRTFVQAPDYFFLDEKVDSQEIEFIDHLSDRISKKSYYLEKNQEMAEKMRELLEKIVDPENPDVGFYVKSLSVLGNQIAKNKLFLKEIEIYHLDQPRPVYVLYSENKFGSLYGMRGWWKKDNFYGAQLDKFDKVPYFQKVYDKNGVKIWQYQK